MTRRGQFTVQMPDGTTIERLPVGYAAGEWWFPFVLTGFDPKRVLDPEYSRRLLRAVGIAAADGQPLDHVGASGGGSESVQHWTFNCRAAGVGAVTITYSHEGSEHAREDFELSED